MFLVPLVMLVLTTLINITLCLLMLVSAVYIDAAVRAVIGMTAAYCVTVVYKAREKVRWIVWCINSGKSKWCHLSQCLSWNDHFQPNFSDKMGQADPISNKSTKMTSDISLCGEMFEVISMVLFKISPVDTLYGRIWSKRGQLTYYIIKWINIFSKFEMG